MDVAKRPPNAELTVFCPLVSPARHVLPHENITLGRAAECTIPIKDRYLSRKHAELVPGDGNWVLKDCGSANGTYLNGVRLDRESALKSGDRIKMGDTELVFQTEVSTDRLVSVPDSRVSATISIPIHEIMNQAPEPSGKSLERLRILNALAIELIEDHPLDELFGFILDRVMEHLKPSRAAIGVLAENSISFASVEVRRESKNDTSELSISQTLLAELVHEKKALAFMDVSFDDKLSQAMSIIAQGIHSVLCAPIMIEEKVVGVLYVDFRISQRMISDEEVRLVAQIARFAAVKLENTRLREASLQKRLMDEELKTAYIVQRRLLPDRPPVVEGYTFAGVNRPCRTVSGDYFDFVVRSDGRVYFVIADVSGKGLTAALLLTGLQAAFRIFTKNDPDPATLVTQLNSAMKENMPQSKFVTLFAARLEPATGLVEFANAGHNPPLFVGAAGVQPLTTTDIILGMFPNAQYRKQTLQLQPGDSLVLFTDGVTEASSDGEDEYGSARLEELVGKLHGRPAEVFTGEIERSVLEFVQDDHCADDVTMVVVTRKAV
ncbi:MAG: SpoIIE family protein phosphatase [Acidobacteriota bacterium]